MKEFVVVRIANKPDGTVAIPVSSWDNEVAARKEYFRQCGIAVDSTNIVDSIALLSKEGYLVTRECFVHPAPEPEPTPDPDPDTDTDPE